MNKIITILFTLLSTGVYAQLNIKKEMTFSGKQTELMLKEMPQAKKMALKQNSVSPRTLNPSGELELIPSKDWVSGFFPGELWYLYEYSHDPKWLQAAKAYTSNIEPEQFDRTTHDVGFKIYCSVGNGYRLTKSAHYKEVIIQAAKTLSARFDPKVGCIKSWDNRRSWKYPVIIDNMMNLELLFEASKLSGDPSFHKIAVTHANTTLRNHYRPDFSSYHVVDYDPQTGNVLSKQTHQGAADSSAWARGQAWGLYSYTMCYRETKDSTYLKQAEAIAKFVLNHPNLPKDKVPYWDFNAPDIPKSPRDVSAASLIASALYELSTYSSQGKLYLSTADQIMENLSTNYKAVTGGSHGFILLHSTGNKPAGSEIDVPISYADYYYLEALLRADRLAKGNPVIN
jgi:unsaturated chondroitin disaccharide hydrolase